MPLGVGGIQNMDPKDKIKAISDERSSLRQEIIAQSQAINRCVFSSMAVFAVLAGIYWNKELVAQPEARAFLLVVLHFFGVVGWGRATGSI